MKKGIIVLLITVLVAGFAFAGTFHGYAGINFIVDFDEQEWGFENVVKGKYTFSFELDTTAVSIGAEHQTDVWAELEAKASAVVALKNAGLASSATNINATYTAAITKADIHIGEDLTIGILHAGTAVDFAKSYYDDDQDGTVDFDTVKGGSKLAPGFTVTFKDWYGGFGAKGSWATDPSTYMIFAHVATPDFKFAEDAVAVKAGAYAFVTDKDTTNKSYFGGAAKASYASDKVDAGLAADLQYNVPAEQFLYEVSAYADLKFVENWPISINVYATPGALTTGGALPYAGDYAKSLKLDAMVSTSGKIDFNEDTSLGIDAYVEVRDAVIPALYLEVGADESLTVDAFTFAFGEYVGLHNLANEDLKVYTTLNLLAKVTYTHEKFTAYAKVTPGFLFDDVDSTDTVSTVGFECGISSDAIVEGADLALTYKGADFADFENNKGVVTASCTINF